MYLQQGTASVYRAHKLKYWMYACMAPGFGSILFTAVSRSGSNSVFIILADFEVAWMYHPTIASEKAISSVSTPPAGQSGEL